MTQVTRRGLLQASLCCAVLAATNLPTDLAVEPRIELVEDPDKLVKLRLSHYIAKTFKKPLDLAQRIVESAYQNAAATSLPPLLLLAVVAKESSFAPDARSNYGAVGLMQVVPRVHAEAVARIEHPDGLEHPESNIATGSSILQQYLARSRGNLKKALKRYSGGARQYAERVTRYRDDFEAVAAPAAALT